MSQNTRATVASSRAAGQELEGLGVGLGQHVASWTRLKPSMAEPSKVMPSSRAFSSSAGVMSKGLGVPEHVGEPQLDEADAPLLDGPQHVVLLALHFALLSDGSIGSLDWLDQVVRHDYLRRPWHGLPTCRSRRFTAVFTIEIQNTKRGTTRLRPSLTGVTRSTTARGGIVQQRTPAEVLALVQGRGHRDRRLRFCDLPGLMQHFSVPPTQLTEDVFEDGLRLRRLVDPGLPGDPGVGHAPDPGPEHRRRSTRSASTRR